MAPMDSDGIEVRVEGDGAEDVELSDRAMQGRQVLMAPVGARLQERLRAGRRSAIGILLWPPTFTPRSKAIWGSAPFMAGRERDGVF